MVRYFLENYTQKGDRIFDPFIGFGTTAFVAEEMERIPYGIEADGERFEWAAGQLQNWQHIMRGDAGDIPIYDFPKMDFCITSPPYMQREDAENPLCYDNPVYDGYDMYLERLGAIFTHIADVMKEGALVVVQADNLQGAKYTPLVHDFFTQISKSLQPQAEIIVRWTDNKPTYLQNHEHTHCLVFKK